MLNNSMLWLIFVSSLVFGVAVAADSANTTEEVESDEEYYKNFGQCPDTKMIYIECGPIEVPSCDNPEPEESDPCKGLCVCPDNNLRRNENCITQSKCPRKQFAGCSGPDNIGPCANGLCPFGFSCIQGSCCNNNPQDNFGNTNFGTCLDNQQAIGPCVADPNTGQLSSCPLGYSCQNGACCPGNSVIPQTQNGICFDGSVSLGFCNNLNNGIPQCELGYQCINNICCPPQSQPQQVYGFCQDGQPSYYSCLVDGGCLTGSTCVNRVCCPFSTLQCPNGQQSNGPCGPNAFCESNFECIGNVCCPPGSGGFIGGFGGSCPNGQAPAAQCNTNPQLSQQGECFGFYDYYCVPGVGCCQRGNNVFPNNQIVGSCPDGSSGFGSCTNFSPCSTGYSCYGTICCRNNNYVAQQNAQCPGSQNFGGWCEDTTGACYNGFVCVNGLCCGSGESHVCSDGYAAVAKCFEGQRGIDSCSYYGLECRDGLCCRPFRRRFANYGFSGK